MATVLQHRASLRCLVHFLIDRHDLVDYQNQPMDADGDDDEAWADSYRMPTVVPCCSYAIQYASFGVGVEDNEK